MKRDQALSIEKDGTRVKVTSVRINVHLHELATLLGLNFRTLLENAILDALQLPSATDPEHWTDEFRELIQRALEDAAQKAENKKKRIDIIQQAIQHDEARKIADVLATEEIERREQERKDNHKRALVEAWAKVAKKRHFSPDKIRRWLPENDRSGDHVDEWEALPTWLSREVGETFTTDEILSFAKRYANGET